MLNLLTVIAEDLLQSTVEVLQEAGLDAPRRRFVEMPPITAPIAWGAGDCEGQLNVMIGPPVPSQLFRQVRGRSGTQACGHAWDVTFNVTLHRCFDIHHEYPKARDLAVIAAAQAADGWQLARGLAFRWAKSELTPRYTASDEPPCNWSQLGSLQIFQKEGGIRGWLVPVTMLVTDTYDPETGV